jgi:hypothetical protein
MNDNALFANRTPEAAALQMAVVLAWSAECHLATLERLRERKSSAKYDLNRQQSICDDLVYHCEKLGISEDARGLKGFPCTRLREVLKTIRATAPQA